MALFKQNITLADLFFMATSAIITHDEFFPGGGELIRQDHYTDAELLRIEQEQRKLAIVYVYLYVLELAGKGRIAPLKGQDKDSIDSFVSMAYGSALLAVFHDKSIDFASHGVDPAEFLNSMDQYTVYIKKNHDSTKPENDYFSAYEHFKKMAFPGKENVDIPIPILSLAKFIRVKISEQTVKKVLKSHRVSH